MISDVDGEDEVDLLVVKAFATYETSHTDASIAALDSLGKENGDNATVQLLVGAALAREGREKEALTLLGRHQGSLDA